MPQQSPAMYFEDYELGQTMCSAPRTVTDADIAHFATLSGDQNPLHMDADYARETVFGGRIAHGLLGLAIASGLAAQAGFVDRTVLAFTGLDWKFRNPIRPGDSILVAAEVGRLRAMPSLGGGLVVLQVTVRNQDEVVVQQGNWSLLVKARCCAPEAGTALDQ
ncbi:MAG: MaoC/PaaZ C-terminal domain-containing protein [Anaerolineae bacterium]|jgi:3-hydroxybutyryl-CoA dehydratase|nr:dehydratase [Chloroflexota bacterium]